MAMIVGGGEMTTLLCILDLTGGNFNIGHHVLNVVYDKIGPIIWDIGHK